MQAMEGRHQGENRLDTVTAATHSSRPKAMGSQHHGGDMSEYPKDARASRDSSYLVIYIYNSKHKLCDKGIRHPTRGTNFPSSELSANLLTLFWFTHNNSVRAVCAHARIESCAKTPTKI